MLHIFWNMFYLDVAYVFAMVSIVFHMFLQVFQMHVSSILSGFKRMLQVLHVNVLKVDRVLHLPPRLLLPRLGVSSSAAFSLSYRCWWGLGQRGPHVGTRNYVRKGLRTGVRTSGRYQARIWDVSQGHEILGTTAQWPRRNKPYYENPNDRSVLESSPVHYEEIWLA